MNILSKVQPGLIAPVSGLGTTTKVFPLFANPLSSPGVASATNAAILNVDGGGILGLGKLEGVTWEVRASGKVFVHGTTPTVNIVLQSGKSLTAASNTTIATLGAAQSLTTAATYPWAVRAVLQGDSTSGIVQGAFQIMLNNVVSAWAALTNAMTAVLFTVNPVLQFVVGVTFAVSDALNTATCFEFDYGI